MTRLLGFLVCFFSAGIALMLAGCGSQPYPAHINYPLRGDLIVARLPEGQADGPPAAGKLDDFIAAIEGRGGKTYDPANLSSEQRTTLLQILDETFGSPAEPFVRGADESDEALVRELGLVPANLVEGSKLYRTYCLQCHGLTGDGRGPTGPWVYPLPRDFRQGVFKYVSSAGSAARKPAHADMVRMLRTGVDRTSMPSFALFSDEQCEQVVAYTKHLSLRGEVEYRVMLGILTDSDDREEEIAADVRARLKSALKQWAQADRETIAPRTMPTPELPEDRMSSAHLESVRRGYQLFASEATGCISCHADYGRQARYLYDVWGGSVRVADLTEGVYRGGKTPLDLFQRIRGGISAAGMPAATSLSEEQVWDLVHFVQALPQSAMLPHDVRGQVYPAQKR